MDTCNSTSIVAECGGGYVSYQPPPCPDNCGGHGTCQANQCVCDSGWEGANCEGQTLTTADKVAIGLSAGIVAAIIIAAVVGLAVTTGTILLTSLLILLRCQMAA